MTTVRVFDPAMCCSTGVCGPSVEPRIVRFAADLDWLASRGVTVERFNLAQQPASFVEDASVKAALETLGEEALPLVKVDGRIRSTGTYPSREDLAAWAGIPAGGEAAAAENTGGCCAPSPGAGAGPATKSGCC